MFIPLTCKAQYVPCHSSRPTACRYLGYEIPSSQDVVLTTSSGIPEKCEKTPLLKNMPSCLGTLTSALSRARVITTHYMLQHQAPCNGHGTPLQCIARPLINCCQGDLLEKQGHPHHITARRLQTLTFQQQTRTLQRLAT
jgi:hypothetical protein